MTPLISSSPAKPSRLTGTPTVKAKAISEDEPPHRRSTHSLFVCNHIVFSHLVAMTIKKVKRDMIDGGEGLYLDRLNAEPSMRKRCVLAY
jgi:hypothetical protein